MRIFSRFAALLIATALVAMPVALCEDVEIDVEDILREEESDWIPSEEDDLYVAELELVEMPEAGSYAWFSTPAVPIAQHSFVDIYPEESPVYMQEDASAINGMSWTYAFTLEETAGYAFYPSVMTVTYFAVDGEGGISMISREVHPADELIGWWGSGRIEAGAAVTYVGTMAVQDVCTVGISLIGNDEQGLEMEFHGMVEFLQQTRP